MHMFVCVDGVDRIENAGLVEVSVFCYQATTVIIYRMSKPYFWAKFLVVFKLVRVDKYGYSAIN